VNGGNVMTIAKSQYRKKRIGVGDEFAPSLLAGQAQVSAR
jgi:hypothetical protein